MKYEFGKNPRDRDNFLKMWKWFSIGITVFSIIIVLRNVFYYDDYRFSAFMILGVPIMLTIFYFWTKRKFDGVKDD